MIEYGLLLLSFIVWIKVYQRSCKAKNSGLTSAIFGCIAAVAWLYISFPIYGVMAELFNLSYDPSYGWTQRMLISFFTISIYGLALILVTKTAFSKTKKKK